MNTKRALATIALGVDSKGLPKDLAKAKRELRSFGADARKIIGKGLGKGFGLGKKAAGAFLGGGLIGGGMAVTTGLGDLVGEVIAFEKDLVRFQIAGDKSASAMAAFREEIDRVARSSGVAREKLLAGASAYAAATGDTDGAAASMETFARVSQATGTAMDDVAKTAAALRENLKIDPSQFEAAFSALHVQGKAGAVELADLSQHLTELAPGFSQFGGGTGVAAIVDLGAAMQTIKKNAGSAGAAATKMRALMESLSDPRTVKNLKAFGINTYGSNGKMRAFNDIFEDLVKNTKLADGRNMAKVFGRSEARDAATALRQHAEAYREVRAAASDANAIQRDYETYATSMAGRIETAMNAARQSLIETFTPERIEAFVQALGKAADVFARVVGYAEKAAGYVEDAINYVKYGTTDSPEEQTEKIYREALSGDAALRAEMRPHTNLDSENPELRRMAEQSERAGLRAVAASYRQQASNLYTKPGGYTEEDEIRMKAYQRLADEFARRGDEWAAAPGTVTWSSLEDPVAREVENKVMVREIRQGLTDMMVSTLPKAIANALSSAPVIVKLDTANANKSLANAPSNRARAR